MNRCKLIIGAALAALGLAAMAVIAPPATAYVNPVTYSGQGLIADGFGGYDLITELCGVENGADADGPYLLWVLTATKATSADITGPWGGPVAMTKTGNGTFKYVSTWYNPATLPGAVTATYNGNAKNAQLVVSHGCRPKGDGWCSPGFWRNATDEAWALTGHSRTELFNTTVYSGFYGATFPADPTLNTVLTTNGGTYKGTGVAGTDLRTLPPNPALNAYNATGAYLTDHIPGFTFDPDLMEGNESDTCPIDHFGHFKK